MKMRKVRLDPSAALAAIGLAAIGIVGATGAASAAGPSTQFLLDGYIGTPGVYDYSRLAALPATTPTVTYTAAGSPVTQTFTGTRLWTLLNSAGGITPIPGVKNSSLLNYVLAVGSDGYEAAFSGGEINPKFGGSSTAPDMVAYADSSGPLTTTGFARMVVPGDKAGGRYVSNLVELHVVQAPVPAAGPGGLSTEFTLSGVETSGTYMLSTLEALPSTKVTATYTSAGTPVTDTYTGVSLWTLLDNAGLILDPSIKNDVLRQYVEVVGSDGYAAIFSLGEIDPAFGDADDIVAYADTGGQLSAGGPDGFTRMVVPSDAAGGRYVSNIVSIEVYTASVPEPSTWALLAAPLAFLAVLRGRRRDFGASEGLNSGAEEALRAGGRAPGRRSDGGSS